MPLLVDSFENASSKDCWKLSFDNFLVGYFELPELQSEYFIHKLDLYIKSGTHFSQIFTMEFNPQEFQKSYGEMVNWISKIWKTSTDDIDQNLLQKENIITLKTIDFLQLLEKYKTVFSNETFSYKGVDNDKSVLCHVDFSNTIRHVKAKFYSNKIWTLTNLSGKWLLFEYR